ncbi:DNA polymerase epsilon subunit 2-like protein, partial [Euroglyphus maynei]
MSSTINNQLLKKFQLNGLNVRQDALNIFESEFKHGQPPYQSIDDFITVLIDKMLTQMTCEDYIINVEMAQK